MAAKIWVCDLGLGLVGWSRFASLVAVVSVVGVGSVVDGGSVEAGGSMVGMGVGVGGLIVFLVAMDKETEMEKGRKRESSLFYII